MKRYAALLLAIGCSGRTAPALDGAGHPDGGGEPDAAVPCYPANAQSVPDCAGFELCMAAPPALDVDPQNCAPGQCSWSFMSDVGDTLTFENEQGWVFLRFAAGSLPGVHTTADLAAVFEHVNFYAKFPVRGFPSGAIYFEQRSGPGAFDVFELVDGRIHVKLSFEIREPYVSILSKTVICGDTNSCTCPFDGIDAKTTFEVDLPYATQ